MSIRGAITASLLLGVSHIGAAWAVEPAGKAAAVVPQADANNRTLVVDGPVFMGDVVKTGARGTAQILFLDDTKLAVGPNSDITIDKFVYSGGQTAKQVTINVTQGAFRFITGLSAKNAYTINTPTATIGVRGTKWEGVVDNDGVFKATVFEGAIRVCNKEKPRRTCIVMSQSCDTVTIDPAGKINPANTSTSRPTLLNDFAFAFRENRLLTEFRANSGSCNTPNLDPRHNRLGTITIRRRAAADRCRETGIVSRIAKLNSSNVHTNSSNFPPASRARGVPWYLKTNRNGSRGISESRRAARLLHSR